MQLISDAQCGNLRIFLTLIFDEKFISVDAESELSDCEFVKSGSFRNNTACAPVLF